MGRSSFESPAAYFDLLFQPSAIPKVHRARPAQILGYAILLIWPFVTVSQQRGSLLGVALSSQTRRLVLPYALFCAPLPSEFLGQFRHCLPSIPSIECHSQAQPNFLFDDEEVAPHSL